MTEQPTGETPGASRRLRLLELMLICALAFGGSLIYSVGAVFTGEDVSDYHESGGIVRTIYGVVEQASVLGLLVYVLFRQGRNLTNIGLSLSWKDVPRSIGLALVAAVVTVLAEYGLYYGTSYLTGHRSGWRARNLGFLLGSRSPWSALWLLINTLVNPWVEELLARAYIMSEVRWLTGRWWPAVFVSVALQSAYHLYQGVLPALSYAALFLTFALYYARTGRIFPVILAHLYFDLQVLAR